jgi:hypothetical protein
MTFSFSRLDRYHEGLYENGSSCTITDNDIQIQRYTKDPVVISVFAMTEAHLSTPIAGQRCGFGR